MLADSQGALGVHRMLEYLMEGDVATPGRFCIPMAVINSYAVNIKSS
jgi:hypothetical protein